MHQKLNTDLVEDQLVSDPFVLICNRGHSLADQSEVRWAELGATDLITLGGASGNRLQVEAQLTAAALPPRGRFVVESTPTAIALVSAGVGAAILPAALTGATQRDDLVEIMLIEPEIYRTISLVRHRNVSLTPAAATLYEMLKIEISASSKSIKDLGGAA
ncbi:LysR substrate-binding domain-containing protein [Methylobacterium sp. J-077]|nr:LysR substrate-binding domain-containing protein [Methylobacterium sp. J-077]